MDSHEKLSKLLKQHDNNKSFHDFDVLRLTVAYAGIVDEGDMFSKEAISKFSSAFAKAVEKGKHPTLNPFVDEVFKYYDEESPDFSNTFTRFLMKEGDFKTHPLDNKTDYLKISCSIDILFGNLTPFLKEKEIKILEAEVQTALFRQKLGESDDDQDKKKKV